MIASAAIRANGSSASSEEVPAGCAHLRRAPFDGALQAVDLTGGAAALHVREGGAQEAVEGEGSGVVRRMMESKAARLRRGKGGGCHAVVVRRWYGGLARMLTPAGTILHRPARKNLRHT